MPRTGGKDLALEALETALRERANGANGVPFPTLPHEREKAKQLPHAAEKPIELPHAQPAPEALPRSDTSGLKGGEEEC